MRNGFTLEVALKMFTEGIRDDIYKWVWLDTVLWPQNTPCAFFGLGDDDDPMTLSSKDHRANTCW